MIRPNTVLATLLILLASSAWPLGAQEAPNRSRVAGRSSGSMARSAVGTAVRKTQRPVQAGRVQPAHSAQPHAGHAHAVQPRAAQRSRVVPASGEVVMDGEVIQGQPIEEPFVEGEYVVDGGGGMPMGSCDGSCDGGCASCGTGDYCTTCNTPRRFCICLPSHGWAHAEYLLWWQSGMNLPALATTSPAGTARGSAGVLPGASVLYGGDNSALDGSLSGGRIRFGSWFDRIPGLGIEGEYLGLGQQTESFFQQSTGSPILARPFFNI
ncbi:MAG: BBP7 family outer membrane beta-barrel protein, partial [Aureliella sp.]